MATAWDRNENSTIKATQAKCPARKGNHRQQDDAAAVDYRLEGCPSFSPGRTSPADLRRHGGYRR